MTEERRPKKSDVEIRMEAVQIDKTLFCRTCGNSGRMILLRNYATVEWVRPGDFNADPRIEIYEHACHCCYGELQCAMTGAPYNRYKCERAAQIAMKPARKVFDRGGARLQEFGGLWPPDDDTAVEFATLREDGWLFWATETARAQIAACEKNHANRKGAA